MSRTDKDRPYYVRAHDPLDTLYSGSTYHSAILHGRGECDAHTSDNYRDHRRTRCRPSLAPHYPRVSQARSRDGRKVWHRKHRASARAFTAALVSAARAGDVESAEDLIDNRQTHKRSEYGCGYWD